MIYTFINNVILFIMGKKENVVIVVYGQHFAMEELYTLQ